MKPRAIVPASPEAVRPTASVELSVRVQYAAGLQQEHLRSCSELDDAIGAIDQLRAHRMFQKLNMT